jgi:predicted membrane-bound spermidine synthase
MPTDRSPRLARLMAVFALSGFSGLIYQSIWSHYLGLTLGHAAYAQTLVLAIFMGGLALGSWLASRSVDALRNAIRAYAWVELAIGVFALVFHPLFVAYTAYSQDTVLPQLAGSQVPLYQWGTAALLILPQCVLLGTTFPLMAAGCLRDAPGAQGRSLGGLYFTNSLGAAIGALASTFVLLPWVGMPGAMTIAGITNLVVAALAWQLSSAPASKTSFEVAPAEVAIDPPAPTPRERRLVLGVLAAAAITGATSFVYEVAWVRLLNLALGTTMHSFELMLAAFILGLAAGAYWIHRRGDAVANTLRLAGLVQVAMGLCALASTLAFAQSFRVVGWLVRTLPHTDLGYVGFNLASATIAMLVMFPTAFFAGSTLPLFTVSLLRRGQGERAVGWVYATNTLGAIVGVLAVVHVLIPVLGLHLSLLLGGILDIALGVVLIGVFGGVTMARDWRVAGLAGVAMTLVALLFGKPDWLAQSSGVYRHGRLLTAQDATLVYLADGKTATVSVLASPDDSERSISTNGKSDAHLATLASTPPVDDEVTMVMLGALPLMVHPSPRRVAVIGWGSGMTTHTLLGSTQVDRVETVEIEPAMVEGARNFGDRVARAYDDPRSHVVIEDARTYFATGARRYDVLVSEPSNPWVSGVAALFTDEFYGFAQRHLAPRGVFVQWIQAYEINDGLQARIIAALLNRFAHVEVYLTNSSDLIVLASQQPLPVPHWNRLREPPLAAELERVGLGSAAGFTMRRLGGRAVLAAYARQFGATGHSDFHPVVALQAPGARFRRERASVLPLLAYNGMPVLDVLDGRRLPPPVALDATDHESILVGYSVFCGHVADAFNDVAARDWLTQHSPKFAATIDRVRTTGSTRVPADALPAWTADLALLARHSIGGLPTASLRDSWIAPAWLASDQGAEVVAIMAAYRAAAERDAVAMQSRARAVLALDAPLALEMRQQMLTIAMTGAAARHDRQAVVALEREFGRDLPAQDDYALVRRFLAAFPDG